MATMHRDQSALCVGVRVRGYARTHNRNGLVTRLAATGQRAETNLKHKNQTNQLTVKRDKCIEMHIPNPKETHKL